MAELKPLGSEKLKGDDKLKRILELTYYNPDKTDNKSVDAEFLSESKNGVYGIVREKDGYYVKKGLNESSLDYIGGMFMKNKNRFNSYAEALKRLELIKGQELLQEETKYMLKLNKSKPSFDAAEGIPPAPVPTDGAPVPPPAPEMPTDGSEMTPDETGMEDQGGEDDFGGDFLKGIQKLTGKLGEKLRDHQDEMESDDLKYVLNSIVSAIDLTKLEDGDKEEVISQLEGDDLDDEGMGDESGMDTPDMGAEVPQPSTDGQELGEVDALEELIKTPFDFNDDGNKPYEEVDELLLPDGKFPSKDNSEMSDEPNFYINPDTGEIESDESGEGMSSSNPEDNFDSDEELPEPEPENTHDETDVCPDCNGTGVRRGKECPTCKGEGVVAPDTLDKEIEPDANIPLSSEDLFDDDPGYDPSEMGEEYTGEEVFNGGDSADIKTKEIELNELTDMIHNTVKETLGKYFN